MAQEKGSSSKAAASSPASAENGGDESLALVARQPIYDNAMTITAYELLYRGSPTAQKALVTDARRATLRVIANTALEIGLDRLAGNLPVHINYPRELIVGD